MKKFILFLLGLFSVLILMMSALVFFPGPLVEYIAPKIADRYGVQINTLQIENVSLDKLVISSLDVNYSQENMAAKITAQDVSLELSITRAVQSIVKDIQIDELNVEVQSISAQADQVDEDQVLSELLPEFPFIFANIRALNLSYFLDEKNLANVQGGAKLQKDNFIFSGQVISPNLPASWVDTDISKQGEFSLKIREGDTQNYIINWHGNIARKNNRLLISTSGDTSVKDIQKYLHALDFVAPVNVINDESVVGVDIEVDLDQTLANFQQSLLMNVYLKTKIHLDIAKNNLDNIQLDIEIDCSLNAMRAVDCLLDQPISAVVILDDSLELVNEYFASTEKEYLIELMPLEQVVMHIDLEDNNAVKISGAIDGQVSAKNSIMKLNMKLFQAQLNYTDTVSFSADYHTELVANGLITPVVIDNINGDMQGKVGFDGQQVNFKINKNAAFQLKKIKYDAAVINQVVFSLSKPLSMQYVIGNGEVAIKDTRVSLMPTRINMNNMTLKTGPAYFDVSDVKQANNKWIANVQATMDELRYSQDKIDVDIFDINSLINLKDDQVTVDGNLHITEDQVLLTYLGKHQLSHGVGNIKADLNSFPLTKSQIVRQLIKTSGLPLQVKKGSVGLTTDLQWGAQIEEGISLQADIRLENIDGDYAQNVFTGLNANLAIGGWKNWALTKPISSHLNEFNIGFPITNISLDIEEVKKPLDLKAFIKVNQFSAQALDGSVLAKDIEIDFNEAVNEFTIYLFSLSLEKLLALNQTEDLIINGVFNGELPIKLENDQLSIKNGWLKVDEKGGIIKYTRIKDFFSGDSNVELLAALLDNFHYKELSAELDMQPDGETLLATKILGSNPKLEGGGAVSLNPNIEINLLKMLHNLRLLSRLSKEITNQVIENEAIGN